MAKLDELLELVKENTLRKTKEEKVKDLLICIFAVIGVILVIAGIAIAIYRYLTPDYLEEFEDDFDDDFEDEEIDDEEDEIEE